MISVPSQRIRTLTESGPNPDGRYVLYWMTAFRRLEWNFALQPVPHFPFVEEGAGEAEGLVQSLAARATWVAPPVFRPSSTSG